jgi:predicted amidophosphoribosyltransferase
MTFCHECGKHVVPPSAKFCRNCGASQWEEAHLSTIPAVPSPVFPQESIPSTANTPPLPQSRQTLQSSLQVVPESVIQVTCSSCGNPLDRDEKYCGICGSPTGEQNPTVLPEPEIPARASGNICASCGLPLTEKGKFCGICGVSSGSIAKHPSPTSSLKFDVPPSAQQYPQPAGPRLCRSCGNLIKTGDKFCSKCLLNVADSSPLTLVQNIPPSVDVKPSIPSAHALACASCGSLLSGTEKFCGICGAPVQSTVPRLTPSQQPVGKTCSNCGKPVSATTKFCGGCGSAINSRIKFFEH